MGVTVFSVIILFYVVVNKHYSTYTLHPTVLHLPVEGGVIIAAGPLADHAVKVRDVPPCNERQFESKDGQPANLVQRVTTDIRHGVGHLVQGGVLADKDEEDEAAPEEVDTTNDPEDKLGGGDALHVPMIPMDKVVDTFKYPQDAHHYEQLGVQKLKREVWLF